MTVSSFQQSPHHIRLIRLLAVWSRVASLFIFLVFLPRKTQGEEVLHIIGSSAINLPVADAAQVLRSEMGMEIRINTNGGSDAGISSLGDGTAELAMSTRPVTTEDRANSPEVNFKEIYLGEQVIALGVSADVWKSGIHALKKTQLRAIYEEKVTNWRQLGGADERIVFFNAAEGRGIWELFIQWLFGDSKRVPLGHFPMMNSNEEARNSVEFTRASISILSPKLIDGKSIFPLAIEGDDGKPYFPTPENIAYGKYPLMKPMYFIVNDKPTGNVKAMVDFILGTRGRALLNKHGYFSVAELKAVNPEFEAPK